MFAQTSVCAQPFTKYHEKICLDHMVFIPTWMAKQPHDMNLADEADYKLLSYGGLQIDELILHLYCTCHILFFLLF